MKKFTKAMAVLMTAVLAILPLCVPADTSPEEPGSALEVLRQKNIISGFEDGDLQPGSLLTRAQFARILTLTFRDAAAHEEYYHLSDLPESHWAHDDVQKAINTGWLQGYPDGTFRPDASITYEEAVTVVCRACNIANNGFKYPEDYLSEAMEHAITDGVNALIGESITREQAAKLVVNAMTYAKTPVSSSTKSIASSGLFAGGSGGGASVTVMETGTAADVYFTPEEPYVPYHPINSEAYTANEENVFKDTVTSPLSTFSIDADTASYSNLRRFILNGQPVSNGSVRTEELINYFDYDRAETVADKPFGVKYTLSDCPWNSENYLLMLTVSGEELQVPKPSNLVFLIDTSGSMYSYNKLPLVKQALSVLLDKLNENDRISIVTYASGAGVALEPTPATEREKITGVTEALQAGGATAGASGINLAYEQAEKYKLEDGNNRIILCTDGDFNVGISSDGDLERLITEKRNSGIYLSVLGFGMGNYKDSKMEILADKGNGNYAYIDNLREAKKVLADEMPKVIYTIAKDVKIQAEFNPEKVSQYRLIGYENRILNNEDFENDKKDAGELGSGAAVTVLYEIVPQSGGVALNLKYQTIQSTGSDELMTVKIRYKLPDGEESILAEYPVLSEVTKTPGADFNFAAAVAELGMILNNSQYKGTADYNSVIELARSGLGEDTFGLRSEFVQLVDLLRYRNK